MEAGVIAVAILLAIGLGVAIGAFLFKRPGKHREESKGILNVDYGNSFGGPELFLALTVPIEDVVSQKQVVFDVDVIRHNSQK